jgi:hypothetical protein
MDKVIGGDLKNIGSVLNSLFGGGKSETSKKKKKDDTVEPPTTPPAPSATP